MGKKSGLPDRWANYTNMGRRIDGTRFICFKVPLDEKFNRHGGNFSLMDLVTHISDLGMVIDLTNTAKYYNPKYLEESHVDYKKIFTQGHVLPSKEVLKQFFDTVDAFLDSNTENDKLIGVHCTHGVNRTGYMVCRYMIQMMGISPDQAIVDFDSARGHPQERKNYIEDLKAAPWINEDHTEYAKGSIKSSKDTEGSPKVNLDSSLNERRSPLDRRRSGGYIRTPDTADNWLVRSNSRLSTASESSFSGTPKGTKRYHETNENDDYRPSKRGTGWSPKTEDSPKAILSLSEKRRDRRQKMDPRYADLVDDRYDRYYYQKRSAGGPTRTKRKLGASDPEADPKTYKGPRWHKRNAKHNDSIEESVQGDVSLGFDDLETLVIPEISKNDKLLKTKLFSPEKDRESEAIKGSKEESAPTECKKKKKKGLRRFLPY